MNLFRLLHFLKFHFFNYRRLLVWNLLSCCIYTSCNTQVKYRVRDDIIIDSPVVEVDRDDNKPPSLSLCTPKRLHIACNNGDLNLINAFIENKKFMERYIHHRFIRKQVCDSCITVNSYPGLENKKCGECEYSDGYSPIERTIGRILSKKEDNYTESTDKQHKKVLEALLLFAKKQDPTWPKLSNDTFEKMFIESNLTKIELINPSEEKTLSDNLECLICCDALWPAKHTEKNTIVRALCCKQNFHTYCLSEWLCVSPESSLRCPHCRSSLN